MIRYDYHPVADLFPLMADPELEVLSRDIEANGLREPIWLHPDGRIIDGRNRYRACMLVGVEPETRVWDGEGDLVAFVVSLNLHRRHLSESQRAMVAAKIANMDHGGARRGDQAENLPLESVTQSAAAELLNVSDRSVRHGRKVRSQGAPELVQAVESGQVPVSTAATLADLPEEEQREVVAEGPKAAREKAKSLRPVRNDRVPQRAPYTQRMQDLIRAATDASMADDDELRAVPVNDLMLANVAKTRDLLTRFLAIHGKPDRTASA